MTLRMRLPHWLHCICKQLAAVLNCLRQTLLVLAATHCMRYRLHLVFVCGRSFRSSGALCVLSAQLRRLLSSRQGPPSWPLSTAALPEQPGSPCAVIALQQVLTMPACVSSSQLSNARSHCLLAHQVPIALAAVAGLVAGPPSSVQLSTTYLDDKVRLGKGSRGSLFVFARGGAAERAGEEAL